MKAVILAAGDGTRMKPYHDGPKALVPLLGLTLIERTILSAKRSGIDDFLIVTGYKANLVKDKLGDGTNYQVNITYVNNSDWRKENGLSLLKAQPLIGGRFVLLMCDHIYDQQILNYLAKRKPAILCTDSKVEQVFDIEDATKVMLDKRAILSLGKNITVFNSIDTGIFLFDARIFEALQRSIKKGDTTLSGAVRVLAKENAIQSLDIKEKVWTDVDTQESLRHARKIILRGLKKTSDGPISLYINRPLSVRLSSLLVNTKITSNTLTIVSFMTALASAVFLSLGSHLYIAIGGIFAQAASILDGCDGEIARLRLKESHYGAWLDSVLDRYSDAAIILGMTAGHYFAFHQPYVWPLGFFALTGTFLNSYTADKYDSIHKQAIPQKHQLRIGRDVRLFLVMVSGLMNQIVIFLGIISLITHVENIRRLFMLRSID